jgi:hypothetical protein
MALQRKCGGCTACCKTHAIAEINKPTKEWCPHCLIGKGCAIYGSHPRTCQGYHCEWLDGYGREEERPDKSKVVLEVQPNVYFGQALAIFEVEEWGLNSEFVRRVTREFLQKGTPVAHLPLAGAPRLYLSPDMDTYGIDPQLTNPDGSKKSFEVVPFAHGRF